MEKVIKIAELHFWPKKLAPKNDPKWPKIAQKCPKMAQKWPKIAKMAQKWPKMTQKLAPAEKN